MKKNDNAIPSLSSLSIKACDKWNKKTIAERLRASSKYKHIFEKHHLPINDWSNAFNGLTRYQKNILIKGELIRTYDALTNMDKTKIKNKFGLTHFSSKWFKLLPQDKKKLLSSILKDEEEKERHI